MLERPWVLDPLLMDRTTSPAEDFYRYANGGWLDSNPIPPEYSRWSVAMALRVRIGELLLGLAQASPEAAAQQGATVQDTSARRFRDYVHAGLDEAATETAGAIPIRPLLDVVDGVATHRDLPDAVRALHRAGVAGAVPAQLRHTRRPADGWAEGWLLITGEYS